MFGKKAGPRKKGKDCGLQEPNGILLFYFFRDQAIMQGLRND